MEAAKIDWKKLDSKFVEDPLYEHIHAPKWVDFLAPDLLVDDHAWFCRPDCRHPKTMEDFFRSTPNSKVKVLSSSEVIETVPLGEKKQLRDANLKRRGFAQTSKIDLRFGEDCENENPNLATPPLYHMPNPTKAFIKSSTEKKMNAADNSSPTWTLKSTLSARNLFAGKDIMNHITEFYNELRNLATRAREKENVEKLDENPSPVTPKREVLGELSVAKSEGTEKRRRNKKLDDGENIPIALELENVKHKVGDHLLPIRTNPPSPQCFLATRPPIKATPPKASKTKPTTNERSSNAEDAQKSRYIDAKTRNYIERVSKEEESSKSSNNGKEDGAAATSLDVFWFFKPCTLAT